MIAITRTLLDDRIEGAVKRIYTGHGVYGCVESLKLDFDDGDDINDFYGTMVIRYGRYDKDNREDLNFNKTLTINVGPKDLENYDFFEGMVYMAIEHNDMLSGKID